MGYWKSKVLPSIKKIFENKGKKTAAAEACKTFDESKEAINKEIEEKKTELEPKVVETYEATSAEVKALVREPKEDGLKKHSDEVKKFLGELVKIEFPGSKAVYEASTNFGVSYVSGPVTFVFEKIGVFLPAEEKPREITTEDLKKDEEPKTEEPKTEEPKTEETSGEKDKEIVEEKKEETKPAEEEKKPAEEEKKPEEEKKEEAAPPAAAPAAVETPVKAEEKPAAEPPKA